VSFCLSKSRLRTAIIVHVVAIPILKYRIDWDPGTHHGTVQELLSKERERPWKVATRMQLLSKVDDTSELCSLLLTKKFIPPATFHIYIPMRFAVYIFSILDRNASEIQGTLFVFIAFEKSIQLSSAVM
jgi:hypothetical protein